MFVCCFVYLPYPACGLYYHPQATRLRSLHVCSNPGNEASAVSCSNSQCACPHVPFGFMPCWYIFQYPNIGKQLDRVSCSFGTGKHSNVSGRNIRSKKKITCRPHPDGILIRGNQYETHSLLVSFAVGWRHVRSTCWCSSEDLVAVLIGHVFPSIPDRNKKWSYHGSLVLV